jgi:hypothetical protein
MTTPTNVKSIASSAMLVELSISLWTARKIDKKVSNDVDISNSTLTKAGNYRKNLLAGDQSLPAIGKLAGLIRTYHMSVTSPWNDSGQRLLTTAYFLAYKNEMARLEGEYWKLVNQFLPEYGLKISAAAFQLGGLFNRDEYPDVDQVQHKFGMSVRYSPVPDSGDFRVDIGQEAINDLKDEYDRLYTYNLAKVTQDAWDRLHKVLTQLSFGLRTDENGKQGKIFTSVVDSAKDLCDLLTHFNVNNDTQLETMRVQLENTLYGIDAKDIKDSDYVRGITKHAVDEMLDKWN